MTTELVRPVAWKLVLGLALIAWGLLRVAGELGYSWAEPALAWIVPVGLVAVGAALLLQRSSYRVVGLFLIVFGLLRVAARLQVMRPVDLGDVLVPALLMLLGGVLIWRTVTTRRLAAEQGEDSVNLFVLMGGREVRSTARSLRGGTLTAVMGGCKLDLTGASLAEEAASLDLFAYWGGIDIKVPEDWKVVSEVTPLMGAYEDKREPSPASDEGTRPRPTLTLTGMAVMGGVSVST